MKKNRRNLISQIDMNAENVNMAFYESEKSSMLTSGKQHKLSQLEKILDEEYHSKNLKAMSYCFNFLWLVSVLLACIQPPFTLDPCFLN